MPHSPCTVMGEVAEAHHAKLVASAAISEAKAEIAASDPGAPDFEPAALACKAAAQEKADDPSAAAEAAAADPQAQPEQPPAQCLALVPFRPRGKAKAKGKAVQERLRLLQGLEGMSPEESRAHAQAKFDAAQQRLADAKAQEATVEEGISKAFDEYRQAADEVQEQIRQELQAAAEYRSRVEKRKQELAAAESMRTRLFEAQKKMAMLEVLKANIDATRRLQEQRRAALEAAKEAKRCLAEHQKRQRTLLGEAMEAADKALSRGGAQPASAEPTDGGEAAEPSPKRSKPADEDGAEKAGEAPAGEEAEP